jgi:hypothetical protein
MEGYDIFTTIERAIWIANTLIGLEVPYETEPWDSGNARVRIIVPQDHSLLLGYLLLRAEREIDDPSDL